MKRTIEINCQRGADYFLVLDATVVADKVELTIKSAHTPEQFLGHVPPKIEGDYAVYIVSVVDKRGGATADGQYSRLGFQPTRLNFNTLRSMPIEYHRIPTAVLEANSEENALRSLVDIIYKNLIATGALQFAQALHHSGYLEVRNGMFSMDVYDNGVGITVDKNVYSRVTVDDSRGSVRTVREVKITQIDAKKRITEVIKG